MKCLKNLVAPVAAAMALVAFSALDAAADAFIWCGGGMPGADGAYSWSDAANWTVDGQPAGRCPSTTEDTVTFPAETGCAIRLEDRYVISKMTMSAKHVNLTFVGAGYETCGIECTATDGKLPGEGTTFTLDGVYFKPNVSYCNPATGAQIILRNGAYLEGKALYVRNGGSGRMELSGRSTVTGNLLELGNTCTLVIDDSTVEVSGNVRIGAQGVGGGVVFKGANPKLYSSAVAGNTVFEASLANADATLDFEVPEGGFLEPPISCPATRSYQFFANANSKSDIFRILDSSPALRVNATLDQPLVVWGTSKGITTANMTFGTIETAGSYFAYAPERDAPYTWTETGSFEGTAVSLGVHLVGSVHGDRVTVSGNPAGFGAAAEGWSPGYGDHDGTASGEVTFSAPTGLVSDSEDRRGSVSGWRLYRVNPETRARTFETSGTGTSCTFTNDGTWHEVEWQWAVEYRVTATVNDGAKGSVSAAETWCARGATATVTAIPSEGYGFTRWTGDIDLSACVDATIGVTADGPKTICANFGKTRYVATDGNDKTADGTNPATPYKTITKAITASGAFDTVSVGPGEFAEAVYVDKQIVVRGAGMALTTVKGNKVSVNNATAVVADLGATGVAGAFTLAKGGVGGTLLRCRSFGSSGSTNDGVGMTIYVGNVIDCVITNNTDTADMTLETYGKGIGVFVGGGPVLLQGCLIADNRATGTGGQSALHLGGKGKVTVRNCTIARNVAGFGPGLYISDEASDIEIIDTLIGDNVKNSRADVTHSGDCYLGWATGAKRLFRNTVIGDIPSCHFSYVFENCRTGVAIGLVDAPRRDYRTGRWSAGWKAATDGRDVGHSQSAPAVGLDCGVWAERNRGLPGLATVVRANVVNALEGEVVTYSWDFDNDGTFEVEGAGEAFATREHVFTAVGANAVTLKVTVGETSVTRKVENVVTVAPLVTYVWTQSPNPSYPYATWETASHDPLAAVDYVPVGGRLQFTNEQVLVDSPLRVYLPITVAGTGRDNDSDGGAEVPSEGTAFNGTQPSGSRVLRVFGAGTLVHSMVLGRGNSICRVYDDSCISNCVIRNGSYTSIAGIGANISRGLVTHCVISNCSTASASAGGGSVILGDGARLLNCHVTGARHNGTAGGTGTLGTVYAGAGCTVGNCTIVGNTAGTGGGLYTSGAALVYNNIIRDNTALVANNDWCDADGAAVYLANCTPVAHNAGDGTVTDDPAFLPGTITFASGSPCANVGTNQDWMAGGATDLFGNKRISGGRVDIGCFEADSEAASCDISVTPASVVGSVPVTLKAIVIGVSLEGKTVAYDWYLGAAETPFASGETVPYTFPCGSYDLRLVVTVDGEVMFDQTKESSVTVYAKDVYLATENANAKFPYGTRETAATNFTDAFEATQAGATLHVMAGRHLVDGRILIGRAIAVTADEDLATRPTLVHKATVYQHFVHVADAGASVSNLVLDDNQSYSDRALSVVAGTVSCCVITNVRVTTADTGVALNMAGGLCDRCEITDCSGYQHATDPGVAVKLSGEAVLRNALIHGFSLTSPLKRNKGIVYVTGDATLESCTVTSNYCGNCAAVRADGRAVVRNNIVWGNFLDTPETPETDNPDFCELGADVTCQNNCSSVARGTDPVVGDPKFRVRRGLPCCLSPDSSCIDKGILLDWMVQPGAKDLYGNPRKFNIRPDIGCAESVSGGLIISIY